MQTEINLDKDHINTVGHIAAGRKCLLFHPEQFVKMILKTMQKSGSGAAGVINEKGQLIGLLTEREILRRIFALLTDRSIYPTNIGKYIDDMTVADVMIPKPRTIPDNTDIEDALDLMTDLGFRYMPVVSRFDPNRAVGVIDEREVAIHVKNRLDRLKGESRKKDSLLSHLFSEPYGLGFHVK